jgi:hypothetical protein
MQPWMTTQEIAEYNMNRVVGPPKKGQLLALVRPTEEAMLYVVKYTRSVVKVGVTVDFAARLKSHDKEARRLRAERLAYFVTRPFVGARVAEWPLVQAARTLGVPIGRNRRTEWVKIRDVMPLLILAADLSTKAS